MNVSRLMTAAAWVLVVAVIALLTDQNRALKAALERQSSPPPMAGLKAGERIESISLLSVAGDEAELGDFIGERPGLIAVFTTTCPYCVQALPGWEELAVVFEAQDLLFVGISLHPASETASYVSDHGIDWPVWLSDGDGVSRLKIQAVPTTILYAADGTVQGVWRGVLQDDAVREILSVAAASAPGLP